MIILFTLLFGAAWFAFLVLGEESRKALREHTRIAESFQSGGLPKRRCRYKPHPVYRVVEQA